jgi:hypothetical protein
MYFNDKEFYDSDVCPQYRELGIQIPLKLQTHIDHPILGIPIDKTKVTHELMDDGTKYAFPHWYVRLSPGYDQRLIPQNGTIVSLQEPGDIWIQIQFEDATNMPENSMLVYTLLYDDVNLVVDTKKKTFSNPYN